MSTEAKDKKSNKSKGNMVAIVVVVLAILFLVAYQLSKPAVKTTSHKAQNIQEQNNTAAENTPKDNVVKSTQVKPAPAAVDKSKAVSDETIQSIHSFLDNWKIGWQKSAGEKGNLKKYFSFYDSEFKTPKLDKAAWQKSKTIRNRGKSWIEVWLTNIIITKQADDNFVVKFNQEYSSSNYSDKSVKKLVLRKSDDSWSIVSEETM